jgi:hypothetical protein
MSFKDTTKHLRDLLVNISSDLEKTEGGNKAASQRVRTATVKLEKVAKAFRKESISNEKKTQGQKKTAKAQAKPAGKAQAKPAAKAPAKPAAKAQAKPAAQAPAKPAAKAQAKPAAQAAAKPAAKTPAKPADKTKASKASVNGRPMAVKRASAKLPTKRFGFR